jgi:hypothetical protein
MWRRRFGIERFTGRRSARARARVTRPEYTGTARASAGPNTADAARSNPSESAGPDAADPAVNSRTGANAADPAVNSSTGAHAADPAVNSRTGANAADPAVNSRTGANTSDAAGANTSDAAGANTSDAAVTSTGRTDAGYERADRTGRRIPPTRIFHRDMGRHDLRRRAG